MTGLRVVLLPILAFAIAASPALAGEGKIGDKAPPLKIAKWVKGEPVDLKTGQGKNVYVVEFWATWCGPCIRAIPHLTELQHKYKDKNVTFIGVTSKDPKNSLEDVESLVKEQGSKMDYVVAWDTERETTKAYREAYDHGSIPTAFIIDKQGRVAWSGHPMDMDKPLEQVVAGTFDLTASKKRDQARRAKQAAAMNADTLMNEYFKLVTTSKESDETRALGQKLFAQIKDNSRALNELAWEILTKEGVVHRNKDLALKAATIANDLTDGENAYILDTYALALWEVGEKNKARKVQRKAVKLVGEEDPARADMTKALKKYEEGRGG